MTPLSEARPLGRRDALSLLGQFAAHLAFLRFAGIGNSRFTAAEWGVAKLRGRDMRLVRVAADPVGELDEMLAVTLMEEFAEAVGAPRPDVLKQSWVRPEAVFAEVLQRLMEKTGDTSSLRRAAWGVVRSPGPAILQDLITGRGITVLADGDAARSARELGDRVTLLGDDANPFEPFSGVKHLIPDGLEGSAETALAEAILADWRGRSRVVVVDNWQAFDHASRRVVRLLIDAGDPLSWLLPRELEPLVPLHRQPLTGEPTRRFLLSTKVAAEYELLSKVPARSHATFASWCEEFTSSPGFEEYVCEGSIARPPTSDTKLDEPVRSFVGALSLLGARFPETLAEAMLGKLGFPGSVAVVIESGLVQRTSDGVLEFVDDATRRVIVAELAPPLRRSLIQLASALPELADEPLIRLALLVAAGRLDEAEEEALALQTEANDPSEVVRTVERVTSAMVRGCPHVAALRCKALVDLGRYADAARESEELEGSCGRFIRALILRRLGDYGSALDALGNLEGEACSFEEHMLSGELHRLKGHHEAANDSFRRSRDFVRDERDRGRLAYEQALLAFDRGMQGPEDELPDNPYYEARYRFYEAAGDGDLSNAIDYARLALERAQNIPEKVDAELDLVFALFLAGDWEAARYEARAALVVLEETQGDRAAAGILFTLAFLCADAGQWTQAEQKIARLQLFYDEREDERRARELDLLRAHLALCRLELSEAERLAESLLLNERLSPEMREAAALVLDEVLWMRGDLVYPRSSGQSQCLELTRRHLVFVTRTSRVDQHEIQDRFYANLCRFETAWRRKTDEEPPVPTNRTEELILLRSLIALHRRRADDRLATRIDELATDLGLRNPIFSDSEGSRDDELRVLRLAATSPFPFEPEMLGVDWRLIARTRTGRWSQSGPLPPIAVDEAERIMDDPPADWVRCGLRAMLWIDGLEEWSEESKSAIAAIVELRVENANLRRLAAAEPPSIEIVRPEGIVGESESILETLGRIEPASRRDVAVCIEGESGTGKELIARAIHDRSSRRNRPFTAVNCAALPENLIESELFGSVRGAFTGADRDRKGLIEATDEGTLFLDEIAEMALPAQAKLLRFLQEHEFRRVGETVSRHADVRIIAATNRRLEDAVDRAEFRDDLYYRIRGLEITVPPLRERGSDVIILAKHFLRSEFERHGSGPMSLADDVEEMLLAHHWPGNVRELQQTIRAAHALAGEARVVGADHLPQRMRRAVRRKVPKGSLSTEVTRFRRGLIERALEVASGNQTRAASQLGVTRQALAYQIKELGILVQKRQ